MEIKRRKIALIGVGNVGKTFLHSAILQNLANEYGIIDVNKKLALANQLDFEDIIKFQTKPFQVKRYTYEDLVDVDLLVITAARPWKPGENRLDMVADNAKIMKDIALSVKKSGFSGITLIASNPVDILTQVFQKITGFDYSKVIGSGTLLDSSRLAIVLGQLINVAPQNINAYMLGEHGDSMVAAFSNATINNKPLTYFLEKAKMNENDLTKLAQEIVARGWKIGEGKNMTEFGVASALAELAKAILSDSHQIYPCSTFVTGQYGKEADGLYLGVPAQVTINGIKQIIPLVLSKEEQEAFNKSALIVKGVLNKLIDQAII